MYLDTMYVSYGSRWLGSADVQRRPCRGLNSILYFHCTSATLRQQCREEKKGAGSEASHLRSCGNMAQDVLPWQPSSTDPLMGCLVCQCDICWMDVQRVSSTSSCVMWWTGGSRQGKWGMQWWTQAWCEGSALTALLGCVLTAIVGESCLPLKFSPLILFTSIYPPETWYDDRRVSKNNKNMWFL